MFEQVAGALRAKLTGGGGAWQGNETTHQTTRQPSRWRRCGGPWPRCPWAEAGPGRASRRRAEPHISDQAPLVWRAPEGPEGTAAVPVGGGGAWPGFGTNAHQVPPMWRAPEGPEGTGGLRDRPLRAAGSRVAISRAAGASGARNTSGATRPPGYAKGAGTEVPAPCRLTQPLPRRGSGQMTVSPGDGDASTGTRRPRRPLPGPLRRSGRRSRCGRGPSSAWWPGRRARRNRSSRR